jgi:hypothetical protein
LTILGFLNTFAREFLFPVRLGLKPVRLDDLLAGETELMPMFADWGEDQGRGSCFVSSSLATVESGRGGKHRPQPPRPATLSHLNERLKV